MSADYLALSWSRTLKQPYFAKNLTDFWRRWHISLSSWLRDYIYIPLGGGRKGLAVRQRNILLVFSHQRSVAWRRAAVFGMGTAAWCRTGRAGFFKKGEASGIRGSKNWPGKAAAYAFGSADLFTVMCFWIFFRSESVSMAVICLKNMFTRWNGFLYWRQFCSRWDWKKRSFSLQLLGLQCCLELI